jgi:hypothetical protein
VYESVDIYAAVVNGMVVARTQGNHVRQIGPPAILPVVDVMDVAPVEADLASGSGAGGISGF